MFVCGCVDLTAHAQRSEDSSEELILSFHLYMASRDQTRVTRLAWQATFSNEPSHWPYYFFKSRLSLWPKSTLKPSSSCLSFSSARVIGTCRHASCMPLYMASRERQRQGGAAGTELCPHTPQVLPSPCPMLELFSVPGTGSVHSGKRHHVRQPTIGVLIGNECSENS